MCWNLPWFKECRCHNFITYRPAWIVQIVLERTAFTSNKEYYSYLFLTFSGVHTVFLKKSNCSDVKIDQIFPLLNLPWINESTENLQINKLGVNKEMRKRTEKQACTFPVFSDPLIYVQSNRHAASSLRRIWKNCKQVCLAILLTNVYGQFDLRQKRFWQWEKMFLFCNMLIHALFIRIKYLKYLTYFFLVVNAWTTDCAQCRFSSKGILNWVKSWTIAV